MIEGWIVTAVVDAAVDARPPIDLAMSRLAITRNAFETRVKGAEHSSDASSLWTASYSRLE
jgi:hypothetical protein